MVPASRRTQETKALPMSKDKIIKGQFGPRPQAGNPNPGDPRQPSPPVSIEHARPGAFAKDTVTGKDVQLTPEQTKAIGLILSGMPYICIGVKPTDTGCDFFTAMEGPEDDLRNCYDSLPGVLQRLYARKNLHPGD